MNFTAIAAVALMLFSGLPSQAGTPEGVCGIVQDQTGAFVSGAALVLKTANTWLDATTDASGPVEAEESYGAGIEVVIECGPCGKRFNEILLGRVLRLPK